MNGRNSAARNLFARTLSALFAAALWLAGPGVAFAQSNSIEAFDVTQRGGKIVVRIQTKAPLKAMPPSFTVASPARIAFDFPGITNNLGRNTQDIGEGELRSMNMVQGSDKTRMVLNLRRSVSHEAAIEGNNLIVTLTGLPTAVGSGVAHFAEGKGDSKHAVRDIDFRRGRAGEGRIVVDLSDSSTGIDIRQQGQNIVVDFLKTALPENLRKRLDVIDFSTPVQTINTFTQGENVRMVIEPKGLWEHNAYQTDTQFVIEVRPVSATSAAAQRGRYTGEKLSLNFQNVEVRAVLNVIADFTDLNIITSDTVSGSITLRLKDVPWDQAMDIILQTRGLDMRKNGNVIWVAPRDELATREKLALEAQQQIGELEATRTEAFQMNYQKASDVQRLLGDKAQPILSKRGSAVVDARTNTLFVQDVPSRLEDVRKLIARIDVAVRQVVIEARIVIADDSFSKNLGVRLGYNGVGTQVPNSGNPSRQINATIGPDLATTTANTGLSTLAGAAITNNVNLPATGLNGFNPGTFSLLLFNNAFTRLIGAEITAMEADGKGKTVSSPRVLTSDGVEALIEQGTEIPYQQASSSGATSVSFRKANLSLKVKPQITPEGNVIMELDVNKDEPGATTTAGVQISTKHVKTSALVENGGTVVIGGIYEETERQDVTRVPFFGDLPYVGFLFKNNQRSTRKTELLIFITPRVVNERLTVR